MNRSLLPLSNHEDKISLKPNSKQIFAQLKALQDEFSKNGIIYNFSRSLNIPTLHNSQVERILTPIRPAYLLYGILKFLLLFFAVFTYSMLTAKSTRMRQACITSGDIVWLFPSSAQKQLVSKIHKQGYNKLNLINICYKTKMIIITDAHSKVRKYDFFSELTFKHCKDFFKSVKEISFLVFKSGLPPQVKINIITDLFSTSAFTIFSIKVFFEVLASNTTISVAGTTIEGNAIEEIFIIAFQSCKSPKQVIGYQHTLVYNRPVGFQRMAQNLTLQELWVTGSAYLDFFTKLRLARSCKVIGDYRTHRSLAQTDDNGYYFIIDGEYSVASQMISALRLIATLHPFYKFTYRIHPALLSNKKVIRMVENINVLDNIWCDTGVVPDFSKANFAIYTNSALILEAIQSGLHPVYYDLQQFDVNPLKNTSVEFVTMKNILADFLNIHKNCTVLPDYGRQFRSLSALFEKQEN
jgi:hypothetical protein